MIEKLKIAGCEFEGIKVDTEHTALLVIRGKKGLLCCGYIDVAVANRVGDRVAIVTGVKTFSDMLNAKVVRISDAAAAKGVIIGVTGQAALLTMDK